MEEEIEIIEVEEPTQKAASWTPPAFEDFQNLRGTFGLSWPDVRKLYPSDEALLDAVLDRAIPEPFLSMVRPLIARDALILRTLERLVGRFEIAVERLINGR